MVERHPYKVDVAGSNPVLPTIFKNLLPSGFFYAQNSMAYLFQFSKALELMPIVGKLGEGHSFSSILPSLFLHVPSKLLDLDGHKP